MPGDIKNGQHFICRCGKDFYRKKSQIIIHQNHFCSRKCKIRFEKFRTYPFYCGDCKNCKQPIMAKNGGFVKPNRQFCSRRCRQIFTNKYNNPIWMPGVKEKGLATRRTLGNKMYKWSFARRKKWAKRLEGENSRFWKGGLTDINRKARNSVDAAIWRDKVFKRDNYTCVMCGIRSGNGKAVILNADHIKSWALYPELRFDLNNGRTLCLDCHKKTDNFGFKAIFICT